MDGLKHSTLIVGTVLATAAMGTVGQAAPKSRQAPSRQTFAQIKSWGYQLQGKEEAPIDLDMLKRSPFDVLVIDYSDGNQPLERAQVEALHHRENSSSPRFVLAYLSVGEAEEYRYYWQPDWKDHPPTFLAQVNPEWRGNYKVRYWQKEWQSILFTYLDRIIDAGFDGAYLDVIDAFEFFGPDGPHPERPTAASDMRALVVRLSEHARNDRGRHDFLLVPQNGSNIIAGISESTAKPYFDAIDAIGAESTFFLGNQLHVQTPVVKLLDRFRRHGKPVLCVDYVTTRSHQKLFAKLARAHEFIPYFGVRELNQLVKQSE